MWSHQNCTVTVLHSQMMPGTRKRRSIGMIPATIMVLGVRELNLVKEIRCRGRMWKVSSNKSTVGPHSNQSTAPLGIVPHFVHNSM